ncbi:MAG: hypothetical protein J5694_05740 [Erysipelotrichaceae bacterium]|nr:hypothetical protein [Erysipelotrichaceae bacterium]
MKKAFLTFMTVIMVLLSAGCGETRMTKNRTVFTITAVNGTEEILNQINIYIYSGDQLLEALPLDKVQDAVLNPGEKAHKDYERAKAQASELRLVAEVIDIDGNVHRCYPQIGFVVGEEKEYEITVTGSAKEGYRISAEFPHNEYAKDLKNGQTIGMEIFRKLYRSNENICFSPLSLEIALAMLYEGARGETLEQFASKQTGPLSILTDRAQIANSLWADDEFRVSEEYIQTLFSRYAAEVFNQDLTGETYRKINSWVDEKTRGMIKGILNEPLQDSVAMVLINALYFKAKWQTLLDRCGEDDFTTSSGNKVSVEYVGERKTFQVIDDDDYSGVVLPYDDGNTSFIAIKAKNAGEIPDYQTILSLMQKTEYVFTDLKMPKLDIEYSRTLNDVLRESGLDMIFDGNRADLTGLGNSEKGRLAVSVVIQKTHLKLDENGTEAAAVTAITVDTTAWIPDLPKQMYFDSPYFYAIVNNGAIMFVGYVDNPVAE